LRDWTALIRSNVPKYNVRSISQEFNKEPTRSLCSEQSYNVFLREEKRIVQSGEIENFATHYSCPNYSPPHNEKWLLISSAILQSQFTCDWCSWILSINARGKCSCGKCLHRIRSNENFLFLIERFIMRLTSRDELHQHFCRKSKCDTLRRFHLCYTVKNLPSKKWQWNRYRINVDFNNFIESTSIGCRFRYHFSLGKAHYYTFKRK